MNKTKILTSIFMVAIFLASQIVVAGAAPAMQDPAPIVGYVSSVTVETDPVSDVTTVVVVLADKFGVVIQTVRISLDDAVVFGLVMDDGSGTMIPDENAYGNEITIQPEMIIPDEEVVIEEEHPVGSALANFFYDLLGVDYTTVMDYHEEGAGFGTIAQALWMTNVLEGDTNTFAVIMDAKLNNDFSAVTLPDGSTPQNWGQFRKAVMSDREKSKENLGAIMSGHANNGQGDDAAEFDTTTSHGNGNAPDKSNNGNGKDKDKSNNGNGKNKDKNK